VGLFLLLLLLLLLFVALRWRRGAKAAEAQSAKAAEAAAEAAATNRELRVALLQVRGGSSRAVLVSAVLVVFNRQCCSAASCSAVQIVLQFQS
jgi:hypothetical protein